MEFFENWPLQHALALLAIQDAGLGTFYYDVDKDIIVTSDEAKNCEQPCRSSSTYLITGKTKTINDIYKQINNKKVPEIPPSIQNYIDQNNSRDDFYQKLLKYDNKSK